MMSDQGTGPFYQETIDWWNNAAEMVFENRPLSYMNVLAREWHEYKAYDPDRIIVEKPDYLKRYVFSLDEGTNL